MAVASEPSATVTGRAASRLRSAPDGDGFRLHPAPLDNAGTHDAEERLRAQRLSSDGSVRRAEPAVPSAPWVSITSPGS
jgi:hypothetical protein